MTQTDAIGATCTDFNTIAELVTMPCRFVAVVSNSVEQVPSYLPRLAIFQQVTEHLMLVIVAESYTQYLVDRLASGLHAAKAHETHDAAMQDLIDRNPF